MVNGGFTRYVRPAMTDPSHVLDVEVALACAYVPVARRSSAEALWALDATLGGLLRGGREPMIAQMRLTWWHEALTRLDSVPPPPQPLLMTLAERVLPMGVGGTALAGMIDGWEELVDPEPLSDDALANYAGKRGGGLFVSLATLLDAIPEPAAQAGRGWALVDLAWHSSEPELRQRAAAMATPLLREALARRWPKAARPLGMLARLALADVPLIERGAPRRQGSPGRVLAMARHAITGR